MLAHARRCEARIRHGPTTRCSPPKRNCGYEFNTTVVYHSKAMRELHQHIMRDPGAHASPRPNPASSATGPSSLLTRSPWGAAACGTTTVRKPTCKTTCATNGGLPRRRCARSSRSERRAPERAPTRHAQALPAPSQHRRAARQHFPRSVPDPRTHGRCISYPDRANEARGTHFQS